MDGAMEESMLFDNDNDKEDLIIEAILIQVNKLFEIQMKERRFKAYNNSKRVDWSAHVELKLHRNEFHSTYRMEYDTFQELVLILGDSIRINAVKALNSAPHMEPIYPELICAIGLRFLAGGRTADIADWAEMSSSSYRSIKLQFIDAVLKAPELAIKFPSTIEELEKAACGFKGISNPGGLPVFTGRIGAIDGMIGRTYQPRDVPGGEQRSYFSGHYQCFGVNIQAICDHRCRFTYVATAAPGSTPDINAIKEVDAEHLIEGLPNSFYLLGDAAYPLSEQLIIPFSGSSRDDDGNDVFNYFLSQLRIRIEMAFGLLTTKFRIFRNPMDLSLANVSKVVEGCARLHNFIIDLQRPELEEEVALIDPYTGLPRLTEAEKAAAYVPGQPPSQPELQVQLGEHNKEVQYQEVTNVRGMSYMRLALRDYVVAQGLKRPQNNTWRRAYEEANC